MNRSSALLSRIRMHSFKNNIPVFTFAEGNGGGGGGVPVGVVDDS